jgi:uncharacterized protein YxjI
MGSSRRALGEGVPQDWSSEAHEAWRHGPCDSLVAAFKQAPVRITVDGGQTVRYLLREKLFHITEDSVITDENQQPVYQVNGKLFSLHNTLTMRDMAGNEVVTVRKHLIALRPTFEILHAGQEVAEMRKRLFTPFGDRFVVDIPGPDDLDINGNVFEHEFQVTRGGQVVATISKRWFSLADTYAVDIAPGENAPLILASVLALDLTEDEERGAH